MTKAIDDALETKTLEDLQKTKPESGPAPKALTKAQVEIAIPIIRDRLEEWGFSGVAREAGITMRQAKEIHAAMRAKVAALYAAQEPVDEPVEPVIEEVIR